MAGDRDGGPRLDPGPPDVDETVFTAWAMPGWASWDMYSPEADFCRFVGLLQRILQPNVVVETGVGVGRLTSHLDLDVCDYYGFESDPRWRRPPALDDRETPTRQELAVADLVILDSDPPFRHVELREWAWHGKHGSACVVHDTGNGHPTGTTHAELRATVASTGLPGLFLNNPRGGWLGIHP
jgi:hypothetical protein